MRRKGLGKSTQRGKKGCSWFWKTTIEVVKGFFADIWLTAILDSKMCWRLDNFLGPSYITEMTFQDYIAGGKSDVKRKKFVLNPVAKVHEIFRKFMGPVDQVDVKAQVMGITRELNSEWYKKQLAFLIQTAIGNAH